MAMDTWGSDSFENDDAADWIDDFCDAPARELILDALSRVAETDVFDSPQAPECRVGIAAAEMVAALKGAPHPYLTGDKECVSSLTIKADSSLVSLALRAVERIKTDSQLKELWDESENLDEWYSALADLAVRLKELDIEALFDVVIDEIRAEEAKAAAGRKPVPHRAESPVESAASIEELYIANVVQRISDLIPQVSESGDKFDQDLYEQFEPLFIALMSHIQKSSK